MSEPVVSPRVAVVTVSYGSTQELGAFLDSVTTATALAVEVHVVDNRPEATVEAIAIQHGAHYLPLAANPGYGGAVNAAVTHLADSVEWVLVSNPDIRLHPGAVDSLVTAGDTDPTIASVGPRVLNEDGSVYPSARAVPSLRTGIGHALLSNLWLDNPWSRAYRADVADPDRRRDAGWLSGACELVRRSAFEGVGGFDERYFMYFEDVDLGWRFGRAGYRNRYEPSATVTHEGGHSTVSRSAEMVTAHHRSARRFISKKYAGVVLWPVRTMLNTGLLIRSAWATRRIRRSEAAARR